MKFGPSIGYHLNYFYGISIENDLLAGLRFYWKPVKFFDFEATANLMLKLTNIFSIPNDNQPLIKRTAAISLDMNFFPTQTLSVNLAFLSYELFRYLAFIQPAFRTGLSYQLTEKIKTKLLATIRYIDFFTNSANLSEFETRICLEIQL